LKNFSASKKTKKRTTAIKKRAIGIIVGLIAAVVSAGGWLWWQDILKPIGGEATVVVIPKGSGTIATGNLLAKKGIIRSAEAWRLLIAQKNWDKGLQAGTYRLDPNRSLEEIATQIHEGKVLTAKFTIPEGWNLKQIAAYFEQSGYFPEAVNYTPEQFLALTIGPERLQRSWIPKDIDRLEGFLFPDTYELPQDGLTPKTVVNAMLDRYEKFALPIYKESGSKFSLVEFTTLASIVEKEAAVPQERPLISGVFMHRLTQKMPLGSDPTVEYAFNLKQTAEKNLTYAQVRQKSPYNTYVTAGLPPTPIASPGKASLEAVAKPEGTDYLYFMARYNGTHIFSRTNAEHEQAKKLVRSGQQAAKKETSVN
jgi:UPF0755 protein